MTKIDPSRLSAIFKSLSSVDSLKTPAQENGGQNLVETSPALSIQKNVPRDKEFLKKNIKEKLIQLKHQKGNFEEKAPLVAIREVLLWEFGEDFINHPDFNYFTQIVTDQVVGNEELLTYLKSLISSYTQKDSV